MLKRLVPGLFALLLTAAAGGGAALAGGGPAVFTPDTVAWKNGTGDLKGMQIAVLSGDPSKAGSQYAMRLKLPDGAKFPPHYHPNAEQVTIISGTMLVGMGDKMDTAKMKALPAGSYAALPAKIHHYAMAKGVTVIELHGIGPSSDVMVK